MGSNAVLAKVYALAADAAWNTYALPSCLQQHAHPLAAALQIQNFSRGNNMLVHKEELMALLRAGGIAFYYMAAEDFLIQVGCS